mmetsp:Transcript_113854/g.318022  ORF Transcript_113854/g.318022 Transcript_113854/m.318022 type:complete len:350 (-) Transcript_113854:763-1812(-)
MLRERCGLHVYSRRSVKKARQSAAHQGVRTRATIDGAGPNIGITGAAITHPRILHRASVYAVLLRQVLATDLVLTPGLAIGGAALQGASTGWPWAKVSSPHHADDLHVLHEVLGEEPILVDAFGTLLDHVQHDELNHPRALRVGAVPEVPRVAVVPTVPMEKASNALMLRPKRLKRVTQASEECHRLTLTWGGGWRNRSAILRSRRRRSRAIALKSCSNIRPHVWAPLHHGGIKRQISAPPALGVLLADVVHGSRRTRPLGHPIGGGGLAVGMSPDVMPQLLLVDIFRKAIQAHTEFGDEDAAAQAPDVLLDPGGEVGTGALAVRKPERVAVVGEVSWPACSRYGLDVG